MTRTITLAQELERLDASGLALCWEGLPEGEEDAFRGGLAAMLELPQLLEEEVLIVPGALMNATYGLTGDNAYPASLRIAVVEVPSQVRALVPVLTPRGLRFFDNLVTNDAREQHRIDGGPSGG
ncbi:hypothetical protein C8046_14040 [Serinibacter arcticus]|uniref:Uncharacterized protein n=1 Tax=Serinibacter arcticus TaxID=1655435 RepID=A0A2U1ZX81_9MICO|nr:hypothetical protein [Serinibacter arcticus]PWD51596.1 hypothetical protein C8046_14040 [Serinibacter arcticus]